MMIIGIHSTRSVKKLRHIPQAECRSWPAWGCAAWSSARTGRADWGWSLRPRLRPRQPRAGESSSTHIHTSVLVPDKRILYKMFTSEAKQGYIFSLAGVWSVVLLLFSSQGCCISSEALILCLASLTSNLVMKSLASSEMWAQSRKGKTEHPSIIRIFLKV